MEPTDPNTPQQNGVAERMNRTIMERARAILDDSKFKRSMWNEAVLTAVHLQRTHSNLTLKAVRCQQS